MNQEREREKEKERAFTSERNCVGERERGRLS